MNKESVGANGSGKGKQEVSPTSHSKWEGVYYMGLVYSFPSREVRPRPIRSNSGFAWAFAAV